MQPEFEGFCRLDDCVPELRHEFERSRVNLKKWIMLGVPVKTGSTSNPEPSDTPRGDLTFVQGDAIGFWKVESLRSLFRGTSQPPILGDYPEAYNDSFALLDLHALEISKFFGDRRDAEMKEIYANLRRRPDGRSLGFVHDYMWQAAAFMLGTRPLSQAEFEAILSRLERSCRTFELSPSSRNYVASMRSVYGELAKPRR